MCCCTCSHMLRGVPYAATEPCGSDSPNLTSIAGGGRGISSQCGMQRGGTHWGIPTSVEIHGIQHMS